MMYIFTWRQADGHQRDLLEINPPVQLQQSYVPT
jgi:hypothetical protein